MTSEIAPITQEQYDALSGKDFPFWKRSVWKKGFAITGIVVAALAIIGGSVTYFFVPTHTLAYAAFAAEGPDGETGLYEWVSNNDRSINQTNYPSDLWINRGRGRDLRVPDYWAFTSMKSAWMGRDGEFSKFPHYSHFFKLTMYEYHQWVDSHDNISTSTWSKRLSRIDHDFKETGQ